jgi:hypothetical protein
MKSKIHARGYGYHHALEYKWLALRDAFLFGTRSNQSKSTTIMTLHKKTKGQMVQYGGAPFYYLLDPSRLQALSFFIPHAIPCRGSTTAITLSAE